MFADKELFVLLAIWGSCEVSTILSAEGISACEQAAQVSAYISERSQPLNPSFCKGWVYFIQCGHIRDQWDVYRQSWVRQHVNPSEPMSLIMLVLLQFDSCNTSASDFGGRVFDEDNVSTLTV